MTKYKRLGQKAWMDMRRSIKCCITIGISSYPKSFRQNSLIGTTTIYWLDTLISIKLESLLIENTIGQALKRMLRPMSKAAMSVWL